MPDAGLSEDPLSGLRRLVDESVGREVKLMDLLEAVGTRRRGARAVEAISAVLDQRDVEAWPAITVSPLDGDITLRPRTKHDANIGQGQHVRAAEGGADESEKGKENTGTGSESISLGLYVGNVLTSRRPLQSVMLQEPPLSVMTKLIMRPGEPVMVFRDKSMRRLEGVVTWESIGRYQLSHGFCQPDTLSAIVTPVETVREDEDLLPLVDRILERRHLAVIDGSHTVIALLSVADLARHFIEKTRPYLLVADIEQVLRTIISVRLMSAWSEIAALESEGYSGERAPDSPDELSFGTYVRILQNPSFFDRLGWRVDRRVFSKELDTIRVIRNDIMHFSPDPAPDAVPQLRAFLELLRVVEPSLVSVASPHLRDQ